MIPKKKSHIKSIAVIGNYLPRQCGIATFTTDLSTALAEELGDDGEVASIVMDDVDGGYPYPQRVKFQLRDNRFQDYIRAADFLNIHKFDLVILEHEYGIFGGNFGSHIMLLLKNLNMPVITTLHTILEKPPNGKRKIIDDLAKYSSNLVVMSQKGMRMLKEVYDIPESKISLIHHGIPGVGFVDPCFHKDSFGVEDRKVILSFGLLSPGKGIEFMINAMPEVIKKHPDAIYIILGKTHPHILKNEGDAYRHSLHQLVNRLKLKNHVTFKNQFVGLDSLCSYIGAADIYVTPYLEPHQIVSGTLAYALGSGKAVISTPYWYAEEMLADGRGRLVPFKDFQALAQEVNDLLSDEHERNAIRKRAYQFGRKMLWKEVAQEYLSLASEALSERAKNPKIKAIDLPTISDDEIPDPKLCHFRLLTDSAGIIRHADYTIPNRNHGYSTDDNSRSLIVTGLYYSLYKDEGIIPIIHTYLSFLSHAFNRKTNRFRNFMSYERHWLEDLGSEDSHGRALWGLGSIVKRAPNESILHMATRLFVDGLEAVEGFESPRTLAFILVGLHSYLEVYGGDAAARRLRALLAKKLLGLVSKNSNKEWPWVEDSVTYANAKIPHALILSGQWIPDTEMFETGINLLQWLVDMQKAPEGHLSIIGNSGWLKQSGERARFEQLPVDAMSLLDACVEAFRSTGDNAWFLIARKCLNWFLGNNDINTPLYNFKTGGCCDGLQARGVNTNQGAESTISWLISLLTMLDTMGQGDLIEGSGSVPDTKESKNLSE